MAAANVKENDFVSFSSGGKTVFIDVSDGSFSNAKSSASACLSRLRDTDVDILVFTHLHSKHISYFGRFTKLYHVGAVVLPDDGQGGVCDVISAEAGRNGISVVKYDPDAGGLFRAGAVTLEIFPSQSVRNRAHGTIAFEISSSQSSAFISRTAITRVPVQSDRVFVLSHGGTEPETSAVPESWVAMNRETAESAGIAVTVNDRRTLGVYLFRISAEK